MAAHGTMACLLRDLTAVGEFFFHGCDLQKPLKPMKKCGILRIGVILPVLAEDFKEKPLPLQFHPT